MRALAHKCEYELCVDDMSNINFCRNRLNTLNSLRYLVFVNAYEALIRNMLWPLVLLFF